MSRRRAFRAWRGARAHLASLAAIACVAAAATPAAGGTSAPAPPAHSARALGVRDEGRLHYVRSAESAILDEGRASGTLPGWVRVSFVYDGEPAVAASFRISAAGGSIYARGSARLASPNSLSPSFRGTMTITGGSGRYAHARGGGQLYGVYYRRSYGLVVQAIATLVY